MTSVLGAIAGQGALSIVVLIKYSEVARRLNSAQAVRCGFAPQSVASARHFACGGCTAPNTSSGLCRGRDLVAGRRWSGPGDSPVAGSPAPASVKLVVRYARDRGVTSSADRLLDFCGLIAVRLGVLILPTLQLGIWARAVLRFPQDSHHFV